MRIIGLGNEDRRDDGAGPEVVRRLQALGCSAELHISAGEPTQLLEWIGSAQPLFVVDAMHSGAEAGHWQRLSPQQAMNSGQFPMSSHYLGLSEILKLAQSLQMPLEHLQVVGIELADSSFGRGLSSAVEQAVNQVVAELLACLTDS